MAISVDWGTRVITIPRADLDLVGGSVYDLDTEAFRIQLRQAEQSEMGAAYPPTHNHNTTVNLAGISYARVIEIINGYTITFEEVGQPYVVNLVGSNNNILDVTNLGTVQIRSNNSAGLINVKEIQQSAFQDKVWIDSVNGVNFSTYPAGTPSKPVATLDLAKEIAVSRGFKSLYLLNSYTMLPTDDLTEYLVTGVSPSLTVLTMTADATVARCQFENLHITGSIDDDCTFRGCEIHDLLLFRGYIHECSIHGTLGLAGGVEADILACYAGDANIPVTVDMGGSGQSAAFRAWSGKIKVTNFNSATDALAVDMIGGEIKVDFTTVLQGKIAVQGNGEVVDFNTGDQLTHGYYGNVYVDNYAMNGLIQQAMWDYFGLNPMVPGNQMVADISAGLDLSGVQVSGGIDEKTLNRVVQGAIPPPPSNGAIAEEIVRILGKPKLYDREFKAIEQRLIKLAKPAPANNDAAEIKQMLRMMMAQMDKPETHDDQALMDEMQKLYAMLDQLPKEIPQPKDYMGQFSKIIQQVEQTGKVVRDEAKLTRMAIKEIPQPDLSALATADELAALTSLAKKLNNYDDADLRSSINTLINGLVSDVERIDRKADLILDNQYETL